MAHLLLVDDEVPIQHAFRKAIRDPGITMTVAGTAIEAIQALKSNRPDAIVLDVQLPDAGGLAAFEQLRGIDPTVPIILITGHGTTDLAIAAMRDGAFDFLLKPLELSSLRAIIDRALRAGQTPAEDAITPAEPTIDDLLIGRCPAMQEVYKAIGRVAGQDVTVLVTGESGTGKELVARAIERHSRRSGMPFVAVNCGAIPESLLESELFGHEKGAFTSAERRRIGKFEQAQGGTIFLDEIGELPLASQVKLLRVLQEHSMERVGGSEPIATDVRVVAATNADLESMVAAGAFRQDLYFRLNVFNIHLPPLRDRGNDVELLARHFFRLYVRSLGSTIATLSPEALAILKAYHWPGNVRELQSVLKQGLLRARGHVLLPDDLPPLSSSPAISRPPETNDIAFIESRIAAGTNDLYDEAVKRMESVLLVQVLKHTGGNQVQAAKILGIARGNLRLKIQNLGITIQRDVTS